MEHAGEWVEIAENALVGLVGGCLREAGRDEHEQAHKGEDQLDSLQGQLLKVVNSIETWPWGRIRAIAALLARECNGGASIFTRVESALTSEMCGFLRLDF